MSSFGLEVLSDDECRRLLSTAQVGRVAVCTGHPAILPVVYALLDGDVVFRTGPGTKLDAAVAGTVVAFEIDEADRISHVGWSVLVVGVARPIVDPEMRAHAARLPLAPWAGGDKDTFVRLEPVMVTGRELTHVTSHEGGARIGSGLAG